MALNKIGKSRGTIFSIVLFFFVVFMVFLRVWQLDSIPAGFFVDESSIAFNGYTLLTQGVDEYGVSFPTYFRAFGEYKNPLYIYAQVPIFALLGVSRYTARLVAAFFMLLAAVVFAVLLKDHIQKEKRIHWQNAVAIATLLFLGLPWSFHLGRVAFELAVFPVLFLLSIWLLRRISVQTAHKGKIKHKDKWGDTGKYWAYFAFTLGLLFYSYTVGRFLSPVLFVGAFVLFFRRLAWKELFFGSLIFFVTLAPALLWERNNPGSLMSRYSIVANREIDALEIAQQYIQYFNPRFLFSLGDENLRHGMLETGPFLWLTIPFIFLGFKYLWKKEEKPFVYWVLIALFLSPIPGSLTIPSPHILRSIALLVLLSYFMGLGVLELMKERVSKYFFLLLVFIEMAIVLHFYFKNYTASTLAWYEYQTVTALEKNVIPQLHPQPYLISQNLYTGTYVTGYFVYAQKTNASLAEITLKLQQSTISESVLANLTTGTVFLSASECVLYHPILLQKYTLVENYTDLCVWEIR